MQIKAVRSECCYVNLELLQCKEFALFKPDCGVNINVIPLHIFVSLGLHKKVKLKPTKAKITAYGTQPLNVVRLCELSIIYNNKIINFGFF